MTRAGASTRKTRVFASFGVTLQEEELYRVDRDPQEQRNLATERLGVKMRLEGRLDAHKRLAERGAAAAQRSLDVEADAEAMGRLRALGYVH